MPRTTRWAWLVIFSQMLVTGVQAQELLPPLPNIDNYLETSTEDAPEDELSRRLKALEEEWEKHKEKLADDKKKSDEKAKEKEKEAKSKPTFKLGGRIHLDHWAFPDTSPGIGYFENSAPFLADGVTPNPQYGQDPEDRFAFRRVRLEFKGDLLESMLWRMQVDFNDVGDPQFKDVYIGFKELPNNQEFLIGIQKRPLGLDHLNSSRFNVFLERPFVVEAFNEDARRFGMAMYGHTDDEMFTWRYGVYNLENVTDDGHYIGDHYQLSANARVSMCPYYECEGSSYMHLALSGMAAHPDGDANSAVTNSNEGRFRTRPEARSTSRWLDTGRIRGAEAYEVVGAEFIYNEGPFQLCGEYQVNWMQRHNAYPDVFFHGAYLYASYFLTGEHMAYDRTTSTLDRVKVKRNFFHVDHLEGCHGIGPGAWQVAARYSYLDVSDGDIFGGVGHSGTFAVNWHWNSYAKVQFNAIYGSIDDHRAVAGYTAGDYWILGTRFAVDF
ncbi:MAG: ATPase [Planctomycetaceae bacterium]|nr:ATPase [Planctomycetaceae bacterium]